MSNCLQLLKDNSIVYESQKDKAGRFVSTVFILKPIQEKKSGEDVEHKTDPKIDQNQATIYRGTNRKWKARIKRN